MPDDSSDWETVGGPSPVPTRKPAAPTTAPTPAARTASIPPAGSDEWQTVAGPGAGTGPLGGPGAEFRRQPPWYVKGAEAAITGTGATLGSLGGTIGGGMAGTALGLGPWGTVPGAFLGGVAGADIGMTDAALLNKWLEEKLGYQPRREVTPQMLKGEMAENLPPALIGEAGGRLAGYSLGYIGGRPLFEQAEEFGKGVGTRTSTRAQEQAWQAANRQQMLERSAMGKLAATGKGTVREVAREETIAGELGKTPQQVFAQRMQPPPVPAAPVPGAPISPGSMPPQPLSPVERQMMARDAQIRAQQAAGGPAPSPYGRIPGGQTRDIDVLANRPSTEAAPVSPAAAPPVLQRPLHAAPPPPPDVEGVVQRLFIDDPTRSAALVRAMSPAQKATARDAFVDWALHQGAGGKFENMGRITRDWAPALKELGFSKEIGNPDSWIYMNKVVPEIQQWWASAPGAAQRLQDEIVAQGELQKAAALHEAVGRAHAEADRLGGTFGQEAHARLNAAKTPDEQIKAIQETFLTEDAARKAYLQGKVPQRELSWHATIQNSVRRYLLLGVVIPRFREYAAVMGVAAAADYALQTGLRAALKSQPELMSNLYRGLLDPSSKAFTKITADAFLKGSIGAGWRAKTRQPGEGLTPPAPADTSGWGPTSRAGGFTFPGEGTAFAGEGPPEKYRALPALRQAQERQLAPAPGSAERAGEIGDKLRAGGAPVDVSRDLERGRLSAGEVGKLLQRNASKDPMAHVSGIPLTELMTAAESGTLEEQQHLLPLIQQRMQQELPKLGNKTTQSNLVRRLQVLQQQIQNSRIPENLRELTFDPKTRMWKSPYQSVP